MSSAFALVSLSDPFVSTQARTCSRRFWRQNWRQRHSVSVHYTYPEGYEVNFNCFYIIVNCFVSVACEWTLLHFNNFVFNYVWDDAHDVTSKILFSCLLFFYDEEIHPCFCYIILIPWLLSFFFRCTEGFESTPMWC